MAHLTFRSVTKLFGTAAAVADVTLDVPDGEFLAVLGPSGCGKTTLLRLVAGFERPTHGEIAFDGIPQSNEGVHVPPEDRRVGIVFQSYALWPHMNVAENVTYPLKVAKVRGAERAARVDRALATVGLTGLEDRRPAALSGGQRQRVALARCLVMEPRVVLLDEPLANLDVHLRAAMEAEFRRFHEETGATMVYITHDQAEAMALADRVAVMDQGQLVQVADPETLYAQPATEMVAGFIGHGTVLPVSVMSHDGGGSCEAMILGRTQALRCRPDQQAGAAMAVVRPDDLVVDPLDGRPMRVVSTVFKGDHHAIMVRPDEGEALLGLRSPQRVAIDEQVPVKIAGGWVIG